MIENKQFDRVGGKGVQGAVTDGNVNQLGARGWRGMIYS